MVIAEHRDKITGHSRIGDGNQGGKMGAMHSHRRSVGLSKATFLPVTSMTPDGQRVKPWQLVVAIVVVVGVTVGVITIAYWFVNPFRVPGELQVLDQRKLEDGRLILLAQRYNGSIGEPSTITVYQELRSNVWIAYYVDHEATYWHSGSLIEKEDQSRFLVLRGRKPVAEIDWSRHESVASRDGRLVRKASLLDRSPLDDPTQRPRWLGDIKE